MLASLCMIRARSRDYEPLQSFAMRAPLLPFDTFVALGAGCSSTLQADRLTAERAEVVARLRALVADPVVREALFCASPSLDEAISAWLADEGNPRARGVTSILMRYVARMCGRATPFGLFSSCAMGRVVSDGPTELRTGELGDVRRHSRLDMHYLTALVEALEREPALRRRLRYAPSSGLVAVGDHLHHAESETVKEGRTYKLVSLDPSGPLTAALDAARGGARPDDIAARVLAQNPELQTEDASADHAVARAFVDELIDSQVLVSELTPRITGKEPIHHVLDVLGDEPSTRQLVETLSSARDALGAMDRDGLGLSQARYEAIATTLQALPFSPDLARLFQVDLARPAEVSTLGPTVMAEVERGVELLRRFARPARDADLRQFAQRFLERYEQREVPLGEAIDEELGIGFGSTSAAPSGLIEGLPLAGPSARGTELEPRDAFLLRRLTRVLEEGGPWQLTESDLEALELLSGRAAPLDARSPGPAALPDVFAAGVQLASRSADDLSVLVTWGGSLAPLLGRFCHGDLHVERATRAILAAEEALQPDIIMAEIVHLPAGRMGNILSRPVLRRFEIPYLGASGADEQIPLGDLLVSVEGGKVRLRSQRLGRWVLPRMTTAHNALSTALSPYRFLCALAREGSDTAFAWSWGAAGLLAHLPRVTSGRVVLSLEQWTLDADDLAPLQKEKGVARLAALRALRTRRKLPRWVTFQEHGDHALPIDLDNQLSCETLLELTKGRRVVALQELFPLPDELVAQGAGGRYVTEVLVPFVAKRPPSPPWPRRASSTIRRAFPPGSEWVYVKLYGGTSAIDALLREVAAPLVRAAREAGEIDRWFFIRYDDPEHHLRLRLHVADGRRIEPILARVHAAISASLERRLSHRAYLDTYQREVERYGGDGGMEASEELFFRDSEAVLHAIEGFDGAADADTRWRLALVGMDRIVRAMGFDLEQRRALLAELRASFGEEFFVRKPLEVELGARYRKVRADLEALVEGDATEDAPLANGLAALRTLERHVEPIFAGLRRAALAGSLTTSLPSLASSYLHMHANRMLAADHRAQELVLYDFLHRHYDSLAARARKAGR